MKKDQSRISANILSVTILWETPASYKLNDIYMRITAQRLENYGISLQIIEIRECGEVPFSVLSWFLCCRSAICIFILVAIFPQTSAKFSDHIC